MRSHLLSIIACLCLALPASGQTLQRIKETSKLNLGYRADAAPLSFQKPDGNPAGYTPLICLHVGQAIANALKLENLEATFVAVGTEDRFDKVASGEIDLLCGAATITLTRRSIVDFSDPVYVDGTAILQHRGASGKFADMAGQKLGVRAGTTTQEALTTSMTEAGIDAEIVTFASHQNGLDAMEAKEIDAYFADQSLLTALLANSLDPEAYQISDEILTIEKQGLALARGDSDFRQIVDAAIAGLYANGKMREIFDQAMPDLQPGVALQAMYLLAPTLR
ncbi:amino acid ABC transporter substrate-binding protein [Sedimentitalea sp. JM2-8]|uniref:Amino acid ABC transporter substrate-binding protein n=1 Tax=Sedimentitalea xiamensis TaxID=3050037 RepID=A0ABT7FAR0_9RHOB|nr:amino acid ABC transporter substrate-binding protein [Sedimentitalea xiamensis]MDK3072192.1 amino acid ABC transporter substrate-binding protein [Sedimentitalea xiamensis]